MKKPEEMRREREKEKERKVEKENGRRELPFDEMDGEKPFGFTASLRCQFKPNCGVP